MAEIKKVVQETLANKSEEEQQTIEKCLRLVGSNRTAREQELGFCLLARMVIKSSPGTLRAVQSRLANRFAQISDHFQLSGSLFVREVLVRNYQAGELHSSIVFKIILNCMDAGVQSNDPTIRGLAAELFAMRVSSQNLVLLLNTLDVLLSADKIKNVSNDVLQLSTLGVSSHKHSLTCLLFETLALSLGYSTKPGLLVDRKEVIQIIENGIKNESTRSVAFAALRSLCLNAKFSIIPMIGRIVSSLISQLENLDFELIKTLSFISERFGPITSTLYKQFYVIYTAVAPTGKNLHEQEYAEHAASLLSSIIESASALIKPEIILTVQKAVCESSIMHPDSPVYLQMLAAFLSLNNEFVPSPLHVSRSVCSRTLSNSHHAHRLRALCNVVSRPRTSDLANVRSKKTLGLNEEKTIVCHVKPSEPIVEDVFEEEPKETEEVEPEEIEEVTVNEAVSSRKKKNSESSPMAPIVPKKKKIIREVKTDLLEGEASVDDILNLFDPS